MLKLKLKTYVINLVAATPTNINHLGLKFTTPAYAIKNNSGAELFIGDSVDQLWSIASGTEFEWSGVDSSNNGSNSLMDSDDVFLLSVAGGSVTIIASVGV